MVKPFGGWGSVRTRWGSLQIYFSQQPLGKF